MPPDAEIAGGDAGRLSPGAAVAEGRYTIATLLRRGTVGEVYRATESNTGNPVGIYLFDPNVAANAQLSAQLRQQLAAMAKVHHKNLAQTGEVAGDSELMYAVTEYIDGSVLSEMIARKRQAGDVFSPKGAYNVVAHLCNALAHLHQTGVHGMLHPGNILVNKAGRVKVCELGLVTPVPVKGTAAAPYAAPEVLKGAAPTASSDIYSVGAILYELLTGIAPGPGAKPPSKVTLGLSPAVDKVVIRCVAPSPKQRFSDATTLKKALQQAIEGGGAPRSSGQHAVAKRPSLAQQLTKDQQAQLRGTGTSRSGASALSDVSEKWLVSKGKLDYGPFNLAQVIKQIESNEILPGHTIVDNETGVRTAVEDHPLLHDIVDKCKQRRDEQRRAQAEVHHAKKEKRMGTTLYGFIAAGVLALAVGAYFVVGALSAAKDDTGSGVAALEEGQLVAKIGFVSTDKGKKRRGGRRSGNKSSGSVSSGADEFDGPMDLGDVSEGDDESERLDDSDINPVISSYGGKLGRCLSKTGSRSANIQFVIRGTGKVSFVKVNGTPNSPLAKCVAGVMKTMKFPSFNGARTRAEFEIGF